MNQSINQEINQSINQPINQKINKEINKSRKTKNEKLVSFALNQNISCYDRDMLYLRQRKQKAPKRKVGCFHSAIPGIKTRQR